MNYKYKAPPLDAYAKEAVEQMQIAKQKAIEALQMPTHYEGLSAEQQKALRELHELNSLLDSLRRASWHIRSKSKVYRNDDEATCD